MTMRKVDDGWIATEQLMVTSVGDNGYLMTYDAVTQVAVIDEQDFGSTNDRTFLETQMEREGRAAYYAVIDAEAMDLMARWWLEQRGWCCELPGGEKK